MVELIIPSRYRQSHTEAIARVLANPPSATVSRGPTEMTGVRADGIELPVEISFTTVSLGGTLTFTAFIRDISRRKEMEATLARQAVTDQLTGLPNRTLLEDRVAQGIARMGAERSLSVLFIDVDHLKVVNDSLSHLAGDQVLRQVAARLCANATPADTVARFGGDTFAFVSEVGSEHNATALATRLLRALEAPMVIEGRELRVTVSIGIALADRRDAAHLSLLGDADAAMYRAKERGRGRAELFDDAMRQRALARLDMEGELRHAIESGELRLQYQPVMDLACETVKGVEALVRWEHPTRGLVPPAEFIPLAEETGLIVPLGTWVLRTACAQLASWCCQPGDAAAGLTMAVNLSGRQLAQPDLVDMVAGIVAETGIDPARLCLEITESVLMEESAGIALVRLHDLGVRLAVDDFGTGYSSLLYLRRFPVDTLKLDQYFVSGLGHNAQDTTIVRATIDLAHALGLVALAEGVEEPEQREVLRTMGCDLGQGFLWSRPVAAEQITRLLTAGVRTMAV
jgi:diguanylate cyclase (GGDEF)-like protein